MRVALCDDHQMMIEGQRHVLEAMGHDVVVTAGNGRDLLRQVQNGAVVDLAIVDISMPVLNGMDTVSQLVALSPKTKCLVMSMYEDPARITEALLSGAKGYLSKATDPQGFSEAVRMVACGQSYISPGLSYDVVLYGGKHMIGERVMSAREREVLQLIAEGYSDKEVAQELGITRRTVRFHRDVLRRDFGCPTTADLVKLAIRHGLTECR